jgi:uncharacterized protein
MSRQSSSQQTLAGRIRQHPLLAYFVLAFAGTWLFFAPLTLSQSGLGLLPVTLSDMTAFLLFALSTYAGPFLAAFVVTGLATGRSGLRDLLRRMVQWRIGIQWYLVLLVGYPAVLLLGIAFLDGGLSVETLTGGWPLVLSVFVPGLIFGIFFPSIGEETGWRGFALPRLQVAFGPLWGSLMLGVLHALWHLPAYPVRGLFSDSGWNTTTFLANSLAIVLATLIWTWLFNHGRGSILFAILIHATSNASSALVPQWLAIQSDDPWMLSKVLGVVALLLVLGTRGRLGYRGIPQAQALPPTLAAPGAATA